MEHNRHKPSTVGFVGCCVGTMDTVGIVGTVSFLSTACGSLGYAMDTVGTLDTVGIINASL